jgi:GH15 family glucan-1,4-alpha-glucosidase
MGTFVQAYGTKFLDASLLLLPAVGFLPVSDPRMEQTIAAIEQRLLRDGFVMRYDTAVDADGLPAGRGRLSAHDVTKSLPAPRRQDH